MNNKLLVDKLEWLKFIQIYFNFWKSIKPDKCNFITDIQYKQLQYNLVSITILSKKLKTIYKKELQL